MFAINPIYSLSGFLVGIIVGLTGVGGGALMTPLLILVFGIHPVTAVGTDLLFAAATKTAGTLIHGLARTIDWRIVVRLAYGSVPMTILTFFTLANVDVKSTTAAHLITTVLGLVLFATAGALIFRAKIAALYQARVGDVSPSRTTALTVAVGALLGLLVSITSVGAGAIGVTVLLLLYPRLPIVRIVGSDIAHAVPLTLLAGGSHMLLGSIDWPLLTSLLVGSVPGIMIGSYFSGRIPERALRYILAAILVLSGIKLVL